MMRSAAIVPALSTVAICLGVAQVAAQSPVDCQQILSGTVPFQIEFSDGSISQISRQSDGQTIVLNARKGSTEAFNRQSFRNGYFLRLETKDSTITLNPDVDFSRNLYSERRDFTASATRSETKNNVTKPIDSLVSHYKFLRDDEKIVGACLLKTVVFAAASPGRCGDKDMPTVVHHYSLELRTTLSSSGQFCRNGEYASFSREAVSIQTGFSPLTFQGR